MIKYINIFCIICITLAFTYFPITLYQIHTDKVNRYTYLRSACEESINNNSDAWVYITKLKDNTDDQNIKDLADNALKSLGKSRDNVMKISNFIEADSQ